MESSDLDDVMPIGGGWPHFIETRIANSRSEWLSIARGWIDPVKKK
jgi:hypothetical protein